MANDYNHTVNLPKTDFAMRASLPQREPAAFQQWDDSRLYERMVEHNKGKPLFVLHDGPPYANASIHLGTALNKVLKDIIVRSRNMMGYCAPYIPGWDTHGLPIELKALAEFGDMRDVDTLQLRRVCRDFATRHIGIQMDQFRALGTLADYRHPYLTLRNDFEARQIEVFGAMAKKGYIYRGLKPVYWCPDCHTALAEAEIEYADDPNTSIYVKFAVTDDKGLFTALGADPSRTYFVIWTTTTWTLPANMALCVGPEFDYALVSANGEYYVIAEARLEECMKAAGIAQWNLLGRLTGKELEYVVCRHPFLDRDSLVIVGDHVTLESGTGVVHTAPGHGIEDFEICVRHYPQLEVVVPVDDEGRMTAEAGAHLAGLPTEKANRVIFDDLQASGHLFAFERITHQYPHCWRCKQPILFRATEQWFCSVEKFRDEALAAVREVEWIPAWGAERMASMVQDRSDWCISRQRAWGVPIPMFFCKACGKEFVSDESIKAVSELFAREGSDAWYEKPAAEILPAGTVCPHCGGTEFEKETDIMDVWFDSGVTHAAVIDNDPRGHWPADLYLEGADQFRGWFQSSLLTAVAWRGRAPYKQVCSHGWVVDGEGKKMSKSLGNGIDPDEITAQYGADVLRLWVASSDYHSDIRISQDILKQLSEIYRKIRNTARYILGNLYDFDPARDSVPDELLPEIDRWAVERAGALLGRVREAYERYEFYVIFQAVHNFCTVEMSNFYLDVLKDRLYAEAADSTERRAAQTAIYRVLRSLTLMLAPILPFTCEEIWEQLPKTEGDCAESVMLNEMPLAERPADEALMARWERIGAIRDSVNKALELSRTRKEIGKSLEARVVLHAQGELLAFCREIEPLLPTVLIVSQVALSAEPGGEETDLDGLSIEVLPALGTKCVRCWTFGESVGQDAEHPELCARCASVLHGIK